MRIHSRLHDKSRPITGLGCFTLIPYVDLSFLSAPGSLTARPCQSQIVRDVMLPTPRPIHRSGRYFPLMGQQSLDADNWLVPGVEGGPWITRLPRHSAGPRPMDSP